MLDLIYIAGPPAAGKSRLMAELTRGCDKAQRSDPFAYQVLTNPVTADLIGFELGRNRPDFPGTDTLGMAVAPVAKKWITRLGSSSAMTGVVLGEGDRLGFPGFLSAAIDAAMSVTLVYLVADTSILDQRCNARGSRQDESWRKGRATKADNLARWAGEHGCKVIPLDSSAYEPELLAAAVCHDVPALRAVPGAVW